MKSVSINYWNITKIVIILLITVQKSEMTRTFRIVSKFRHQQSCSISPLRGESELMQVLVTQ